MKKKHQKDVEKAEKLKEKQILEKAEKAKKNAVVVLDKKRLSGLGNSKSGGGKKRRKSTGSILVSNDPNLFLNQNIDRRSDEVLSQNNLKSALEFEDDNNNDNNDNSNYNSSSGVRIDQNMKFDVEEEVDSDGDLWDDCYHHSQ